MNQYSAGAQVAVAENLRPLRLRGQLWLNAPENPCTPGGVAAVTWLLPVVPAALVAKVRPNSGSCAPLALVNTDVLCVDAAGGDSTNAVGEEDAADVVDAIEIGMGGVAAVRGCTGEAAVGAEATIVRTSSGLTVATAWLVMEAKFASRLRLDDGDVGRATGAGLGTELTDVGAEGTTAEDTEGKKTDVGKAEDGTETDVLGSDTPACISDAGAAATGVAGEEGQIRSRKGGANSRTGAHQGTPEAAPCPP
jgi:hypothetical protein